MVQYSWAGGKVEGLKNLGDKPFLPQNERVKAIASTAGAAPPGSTPSGAPARDVHIVLPPTDDSSGGNGGGGSSGGGSGGGSDDHHDDHTGSSNLSRFITPFILSILGAFLTAVALGYYDLHYRRKLAEIIEIEAKATVKQAQALKENAEAKILTHQVQSGQIASKKAILAITVPVFDCSSEKLLEAGFANAQPYPLSGENGVSYRFIAGCAFVSIDTHVTISGYRYMIQDEDGETSCGNGAFGGKVLSNTASYCTDFTNKRKGKFVRVFVHNNGSLVIR